MHYTHPSKGLKFQLVLSTSLWEHDQHHRETAVKLTAVQDAMQILEGRREGRTATFIYLLHFFLTILYTSDWHQYFLCPSHYSLQLVEKIEFFQPNFAFLPSACPKQPLHSSVPVPQPILLFPLHTVLPAFMSLYCYLYSFELLLVFTLLCKHAERINTHFQRLYPSDHLTT